MDSKLSPHRTCNPACGPGPDGRWQHREGFPGELKAQMNFRHEDGWHVYLMGSRFCSVCGKPSID